MRRSCLAAALVLLLPTLARAQQGDERAQARQLFREGLSALDEGRFAEAADALARSLAIRDSAPGRYNRALALRGAGRYREAIEELDRFAELATGARMAGARTDAIAMRDELRSSLVHLRLELRGAPESAQLDGGPLEPPEGVHELELDPGTHRIALRREGYAPVERELELSASSHEEISLDASESPLAPRLRVEVEPATAAIHLDGTFVGRGAIDLETTVGAHELEIRADGHVTETRSVELTPGDADRFAIALAEETGVDLVEEWWFWLIVGLGAAAAGAAISAGIVVANDVPEIQTGTFGFAQEVLRLRF